MVYSHDCVRGADDLAYVGPYSWCRSCFLVGGRCPWPLQIGSRGAVLPSIASGWSITLGVDQSFPGHGGVGGLIGRGITMLRASTLPIAGAFSAGPQLHERGGVEPFRWGRHAIAGKRLFLVARDVGAIDRMRTMLLAADAGCDICGSWSADESSEQIACYDWSDLDVRLSRAKPDVVIVGGEVSRPWWRLSGDDGLLNSLCRRLSDRDIPVFPVTGLGAGRT